MKSSYKEANRNLAGRLLPVILWLLPILALNLGFRFIARIELYWHEKSQQELARQELEALNVGSEYEYQIARHAGRFLQALEAAENINQASIRAEFLQTRYQNIFPSTFPASKVFAFQQPGPGAAFGLIFANTERIKGRRALSLVFQHLVETNLNLPVSDALRRQRERLLQQFIGKAVKSDIMALSQRGKATYIMHEGRPHWFVWDFREGPENSLNGCFILTRMDRSAHAAAKLMALRECRQRGNGLAAFVPLVPGHGGAVLFARLARSQKFRNWVKKALPLLNQDFLFWIQKGAPEGIELGNYKVFTYLGKNRTHLSVFLIRKAGLRALPFWIWWLNLLAVPAILLFSLRGILFNEWPKMRLTVRFLLLFSLAASLPLSLVAVTTAGYLYQFNFSSQDQAASNLKSCLSQFDARKSQIQEAYRVTSMQVFNDKKLAQLIADKGIRHDDVRDRVLSFFKKRPDPLPLLGFYILDLAGEGLHYYEGTTASRLDPAFDVFKVPIIKTLRKRFARQHPEIELPEFKVSEIQEFGGLAYKSVSANDLGNETEKRRTYPITRRIGIHTATQMHDFIRVNGRESVMIYIIWDDKSLDTRTLKATSDYLGLNFSTFAFVAFRVTPAGLKPIISPGRHVDTAFTKNAEKVAQSAASRGGSVNQSLGQYTFVARPSRNYQETIIVGGLDNYYVYTEMQKRLVILSGLILASMLIIALCAWLASIFLVKPIGELRSALEQVSDGNLGIRISSDRQDELGGLAENFTSMVQGMKERQQLATLLSDQAIEAISGDRLSHGKVLPARSFEGVALVSDIRNFTTLCEQKSAAEITGMLNRHFAVMAKIVTTNGGRIYKFIGDAIEAIFPEDEEGCAARRALKAAVEMNCAIAELNQARKQENLFEYSFGVGLAHGTFFSGQIGSEETRIDYAVIGEPLNRAAELEAASKQAADFPLVVDEKIKNSFENEIGFTKLEAGEKGFSPDKNSQAIAAWIKAFGVESGADESSVELSGPEKKWQDKTILAGNLTRGMRWGALFLFALFVTLVGAGVLWGISNRNAANRAVKYQQARETIFRLAEQLKSEGVVKTGFEMKMKRLIRRIEDRLAWKPQPTDRHIIEKLVSSELKGLQSEGFPSSRAAAFFFNEEFREASDPEKTVETLVNHELPANHEKILKTLACYKFKRFYNLERDNLVQMLEGKSEEAFGQNFTSQLLVNELFASAMSVTFNNRSEYFYWNFITVYDPEIYETAFIDNTRPLKNCPESRIRIVGMIMVGMPTEQVRNSAEFIVSGYDEPGYDFALVSSQGKVVHTSNFPRFPDSHKIAYDSALPDLPGFVINEQVLRLGHERYRLLTVVKTAGSEFDLRNAGLIIFALVILAVIFFYHSVFYRTLLSRSLTAQLWFSILLIAMVPFIIVVFVMDLFLGEHQQTKVMQEKVELQRFMDAVELRQFYFKPVTQHILEKWSESPVLVAALKKFDDKPDCRETHAQIDRVLQHQFKVVDEPYGYGSNFTPRELIVIGKKGWRQVFTNVINKDTSELSQVLVEVGRNILDQLQKDSGSVSCSTDKVKSEMYFEAGLATIRSSFGEDETVRLGNVLEEIIELEVVTGAAVIYIKPMPSIEQPDYLLFWISMFSSGSYLDRIAQNSLDRHAIFSIQNHAYGILAQPDRHLGELGLERPGAWISGSNLPVSEERRFGNQTLLLEGRQGIAQFTNFLLAVAAKTAIVDEIGVLRLTFTNLLLLSLAIILLVAHHTAVDIIGPIRSLAAGMQEIEKQNLFYRINLRRDDELGELCQAYDELAKGLAEKEIMGKMLSQSAVNSVSRDLSADSETRKQFAFLFVGSPGFSSWLGTGTAADLFADLQKQTAKICSIIVEEGGDIDKFIGDKQLGIFAADDPAQAVARALKAVCRIMKAEESGELPFPVAVGANYGEVINGYLGVGDKRDFTVIGDAVNISARIEKEAEKMRFRRSLFSQAFIEELTEKHEFRLHAEVQLKGKSSALPLFTLQ